MSNRRDFIRKASLGGLTLSLSGSPYKTSTAAPDGRIGIITNTVTNEMQADYREAYQKLAEIGYKVIEGGTLPEGMSAKALGKYLKSLGMRSIATGTSMGNLEEEGIDPYLQKAEALGAEYVVCYYPWLSSAENLKMPEVLEAAERINAYGKQAKEAGFRFAWHNHAKEFAEVDGQLAFDILMENTDPDYSTVQLDWYWVVKGGQDPVTYFNRYPGRFELAHVKDMNNNRDRGITCVGNGIIDFEPIFLNAPRGGVRYFVVENERAIRGYPCAQGSYEHISQMLAKTGI
jgi:sugar phosphate isomerase/epimerase